MPDDVLGKYIKGKELIEKKETAGIPRARISSFKSIVRIHEMRKEIEIRKSMPPLSREIYIDFLKKLEEILSAGRLDEFRPYDPEGGCLVKNLSKLPADKLDFGIGGPKLAVPLTIEKNAAAKLAKDENFMLRLAY